MLQVGASDSTFLFDSPYWTNEETLNDGLLDDEHFTPLADTDAKYPSFAHTPIDAIRGCLSGLTDADCKSYEGLDQYDSAMALFVTAPIGSSGVIFPETLEEAQGWLAINSMTCSDTSSACNFAQVGINLDDDLSDYQARTRFGLLTNNEADITTANDCVGFGCQVRCPPRCSAAVCSVVCHLVFETVFSADRFDCSLTAPECRRPRRGGGYGAIPKHRFPEHGAEDRGVSHPRCHSVAESHIPFAFSGNDLGAGADTITGVEFSESVLDATGNAGLHFLPWMPGQPFLWARVLAWSLRCRHLRMSAV